MDVPRFSTIQTDYQNDSGLQSSSGSLSRQLEQLAGLIRRQYLLIIAICALAVAFGAALLIRTPPTYTAHARLLIDSSKARAVAQQAMPGYFIPIDFTEIMTQVEVLKSDGIALDTIKGQHLTANAAFVGGTGEGPLQTLIARVRGLFGVGTSKTADVRSETELTRAALGAFQSQRNVTRVAQTYVLDIAYTAGNPELAAKIANAIADTYIDYQLDAKYQSTRRANKWLQDRIKDLRTQSAAADLAVLDYKKKNKIIDLGGSGASSGGRWLDDEQVIQLNAQLTSARGAEAEAGARLERINDIMKQDVPDAGTVDSLSSGVIVRLRNQYLDLAARERIFAARYGADHLAVVNLRTQMAELRRSIADELNRIAQSYKSDFEIAKARVQTLENSLTTLVSKAQLINRDRIGLSDLEATSKIYRTIYDNFLNRYMEASQQESFPITEARVISPAQPGNRSGPDTNKIMASSLFIGLILGFGAAFLRETFDRVFRTRHQVEAILRTNCLAVLPRLTASTAVTQSTSDMRGHNDSVNSEKKHITDEQGSFSRVIDEPRSLFAEGLRSIKVAADIANAIKENKVLGVTSSIPREGKSTIASNLAQLMAHAGKRVLLVDGDLRNRTLTRGLGRSATAGLVEVLAGQIELSEAVYTDDRSNLMFLPAIVDSRLAHTDEILASASFKQLLSGLRKQYDYIIVDLPPLAPVSDARATVGIIDSYIYVIEWGRTRVNVVQNQLTAAPELGGRLLGVVLSKADLKMLARYEHYYGRNYYYDGQYGYGSG